MDIDTIREMIAEYNDRWPDTSENDVYLFVDERDIILRYWRSDEDVPNTNGIGAIVSFLSPRKSTLVNYSVQDLVDALKNYNNNEIMDLSGKLVMYDDVSGRIEDHTGRNRYEFHLWSSGLVNFIEKYK